ncbi:PRC-barrel domain-containing protein [Planosporangium mesophilum]|uniref:PRC-barrel domain-containing protein n=1 Tax=Planosporangium mesophilum TaxID=689768 RepID=A0A8J3TEM0_9ACTN|nr:PRC-barrel domain-containing protein [Planosporangium mesophilum]GII23757.1 hypothetical protein Pme01_33540 [Planosporangium mesophilum]
MRASDLIRCRAYDRTGACLGTVVDLVAAPDGDGTLVVVAVVVSRRWHGRLLGHERSEGGGPWLLERAMRLMSRGMRTVAWSEVRIDHR